MGNKPQKPTYMDLQRKITELEAQGVGTIKQTLKDISKTGQDHIFGSAIIVNITTLGGRKVLPPFAIYDGFSVEVLQALTMDLEKTLKRLIG